MATMHLTWAEIIAMFKYEPLTTAGTKLNIVSEKNAGMAMNNKTVTQEEALRKQTGEHN